MKRDRLHHLTPGHGRRLHVEALETRRMLSVVPELLKDISVIDSSSPSYLVEVGSTDYFAASDGINGRELWKTDGTSAGTELVKDIRTGSAGSMAIFGQPFLTNFNGTLFFRANDGTNGYELWKSDGTSAGTVLVKDIRVGSSGSSLLYLTNVSGTLFFTANDGTTGIELWKSDGTSAGTVLVKDIRPGTARSLPAYLTNVNGTLFFRANDGTNGYELWKSDGTEAGTVLVKDIRPGYSSGQPVGSYPRLLRNVNGTLLFQANDGTNGTELWKSDGTTAGTVLVKDINPVAGNSSIPRYLTNVNGTLFFSANDGTNGTELWKSDGTSAGTVMVKDIVPGAGGLYLGLFTNVNGTLFFGNSGGLWKSDGTAAGTVPVTDIAVSSSLTNVNGTLFFGANDGTTGTELWKSDGTSAGTVLVKDIRPGTYPLYPQFPYNSSPGSLSNVNGTLFFTANDGTNGIELWKSDGTSAGTVLVKDINAQTQSASSPGQFTEAGDAIFFAASDGITGQELWRTDGISAGTVLVKDINPVGGSSSPTYLTDVNGTLFFKANDGTNGTELWKSDGTSAGTVLVKDINPVGSTGSNPLALTNVNGTLFFRAYDGTSGYELWKSDGTSAGTVMVKDINPVAGSIPRYLTNVGGTLFFKANNGTNGYELWKSDGTSTGTVLVKDIFPGSQTSFAASLTNVNGTLFFQANDGTNGQELWKSDGTSAGTVLVQDILAGSGSSFSSGVNPQLTNINGTLFFSADDGIHGREPWVLRVPSAVVDQKLFYNGSTKWNVANGATFSDDNAIAPDKTAYLPGSGTSAFSAVSSYSRGINGLMVDLAGAHGTITASDFIFKVGNNNSPGTWATATGPTTVTTRVGSGAGGSDRIELMWADGAIQKQWLEVVVKGNDALGGSNTNTGLDSSYVFYFGNAVGDAGAADGSAFSVTPSDEISARNDPHGIGNPATISNVNDFDRNGLVNSSDQIIARNNGTGLANQLTFLAVGAGGPFAPGSSASRVALVDSASRFGYDAGVASALASATVANPTTIASSMPPEPRTSPARVDAGHASGASQALRSGDDDQPQTVARASADDHVERWMPDDDLLDVLASALTS